MVSLSVSSCLCVFQLEEVTRQAETEKQLKEEAETKGNVGFLPISQLFQFLYTWKCSRAFKVRYFYVFHKIASVFQSKNLSLFDMASSQFMVIFSRANPKN